MKVISTTNAPGAIGPYSQGFVVNGMVFTSGQIPINPATGEMPEGIAAQTEQSCKNVIALLEAAGSGAEKKAIVTEFIKKLLLQKNIALSDEEINTLIEAAVRQMKIDDGTIK